MNAETGFYLKSSLAPLASILARDDVTDIYINRPGEVWIETLGGAIARVENAELTASLLMRLARQIAAMSSQGISREHPLLSATLADGARVQVVVPPATRGEIAIAIRKHVSAHLGLGDYSAAAAFTDTRIVSIDDSRGTDAFDQSIRADEPAEELLRNAVLCRRNILISGGTSSGKTTLLNALVKEIPPEERLIFIEDTPELEIRHANAIGLLAARSALSEAQIGAEDLLNASLRMRPDRILLGEVRGPEAFTFLRAINTGHPGSITTIHADSPRRAIDQLALLILQSGAHLEWDDIVRYVRSTIELFVQIERRGGQRVISQIALAEQLEARMRAWSDA